MLQAGQERGGSIEDHAEPEEANLAGAYDGHIAVTHQEMDGGAAHVTAKTMVQNTVQFLASHRASSLRSLGVRFSAARNGARSRSSMISGMRWKRPRWS